MGSGFNGCTGFILGGGGLRGSLGTEAPSTLSCLQVPANSVGAIAFGLAGVHDGLEVQGDQARVVPDSSMGRVE